MQVIFYMSLNSFLRSRFAICSFFANLAVEKKVLYSDNEKI